MQKSQWAASQDQKLKNIIWSSPTWMTTLCSNRYWRSSTTLWVHDVLHECASFYSWPKLPDGNDKTDIRKLYELSNREENIQGTPQTQKKAFEIDWCQVWVNALYHHHHLSLNCEGRLGTAEDFATSWRTPGLSTPWCCLLTSSSVCPVFFPPSLCLAQWFWPDLMNGRHDHTTAVCVRRSSCGLIACWILAWTSSLVTWSLHETCSILQKHLISMTCILLWSSAGRVHDSQVHRNMDVTRECISRILELREILLSFQTGFNFVNAAVLCAILENI